MKRTIALLSAALLGLTLLIGCNQQASQVSIGVVDDAALFQDNKVTAGAMAYLQELGAPLQKKAEEAYKAMQADQNEQTVATYKQAMGELQGVMQAEQQRVIALIDTKFNEIIENYRKEKGLTLIVKKESVFAADESADITADILAAMEKVAIDYSAPKAEAPAAAEAETPAAPEAPATEEKKSE